MAEFRNSDGKLSVPTPMPRKSEAGALRPAPAAPGSDGEAFRSGRAKRRRRNAWAATALQYTYRSPCICYFSSIPLPGSIVPQRVAPCPTGMAPAPQTPTRAGNPSA